MLHTQALCCNYFDLESESLNSISLFLENDLQNKWHISVVKVKNNNAINGEITDNYSHDGFIEVQDTSLICTTDWYKFTMLFAKQVDSREKTTLNKKDNKFRPDNVKSLLK